MCILGAGCLMYWSEAVRSVPGATSEARRERTTGDNPDEYMHISQVQELLERSKQLEQEARENREKAGKLQTDLEIARQEKGTPAVGCNTHKILEIVERIDEVKKIPTFNDTVYEIDRNTLDMWVKRLKDELKR